MQHKKISLLFNTNTQIKYNTKFGGKTWAEPICNNTLYNHPEQNAFTETSNKLEIQPGMTKHFKITG